MAVQSAEESQDEYTLKTFSHGTRKEGNMSAPEHQVNIIVNGRPKKVQDKPISFEEVVALAFNPAPPGAFFTVTWSHGNQGGSLVSGKNVPVQNGMKFDVTETGQS